MKSLFPSYYQPTPQEFQQLWKECVFVLDTNMLFYLYRSSETARNELLNLLKHLKDRIWLPYQVALEYQRDRLTVIDSLSNEYNRLNKMLSDIKKINLIDSGFVRHPILEANLGEIQKKIDQAFKDYQAALESIKTEIELLKSEHPKWHEHDTNRDEIDSLFEGKIGRLYSQDELNKIFLEGEHRYESKTPPGYMDSKEKEGTKKYGDLVLWFQIIDYAQESQKSIIFVTDDRKEDWWLGGRENKEEPRPELIQEFFVKTKGKFYAYQPKQFLTLAETHLQLAISQATKEEIQAIGDAAALEERDKELVIKSSGNPYFDRELYKFLYNPLTLNAIEKHRDDNLQVFNRLNNDLQALKRHDDDLQVLNRFIEEQRDESIRASNRLAEDLQALKRRDDDLQALLPNNDLKPLIHDDDLQSLDGIGLSQEIQRDSEDIDEADRDTGDE